MEKYFNEYEFETELGNRYWFPIYHTAKSGEEVEKLHMSIIDSINNERHRLLRCTQPTLVQNHIHKKHWDYYMDGQIQTLQMDTWKFIPQTEMTTSFERKLDSVQFESLVNKDRVAQRTREHICTGFCYKRNPDELEEFLRLNIVDPLE